MIEPVDPEAIEVPPRTRLTSAERREVLERQHYECDYCHCNLRIEIDGQQMLAPMVDDHIIPRELGGSDELTNRHFLCVSCDKKKTANDQRRIAKTRRQRRAHLGQKPRLGPRIRSAGFRKDPLRSYDR